MDLMGSDALQSEDEMREMWGDSMKAVKCQHARITYDDFLLLMKGQSKEASSELDLGASVSSIVGSSQLYVVEEAAQEADSHHGDSSFKGGLLKPRGGDMMVQANGVNLVTNISDESPISPSLSDSNHTPIRSASTTSSALMGSQSAPSTPAGHKHILDMDTIDSPLSMDDDDDINTSGPGVPGTSASLTPPLSPERGATDYVTPLSGRRTSSIEIQEKLGKYLALPGLSSKPSPYTRRRSRSVDDQDKKEGEDGNLHVVAHAVRDMLLPETDHAHVKKFDELVGGKDSKSALQVNRQLYRAHRQMRLAVLEASKRFEEQQAEHARDVILAQRQEADQADPTMGGMIQAGLVMRHGHKKQVSSEAIGQLLRQNRSQQQALVEKANRRGGRGRRSRKKTISDMSGMLSSMGQDELATIAAQATEAAASEEIAAEPTMLAESKTLGAAPTAQGFGSSDSQRPDIVADDGTIRGATVPGEFRSTKDPFGKQGRYGAVATWKP